MSVPTCLRKVLTAAFLAGFLASPGQAQYVGTHTGTNAFPFGGPSSGFAGTVYQQVYASSNFAVPGTLTELRFFLSSGSTLRSGTYDIYLSTTSVAVNALSTADFNSNRGADNMLFGSFVLGSAAPGVLSFVGVTGFSYNPLFGNLLMDIRISGGDATSLGSFWRSNNDDAGGLYSRAHDFGTAFENYGLNTEFIWDDMETVVPEPATLVLLATGLAGLGAAGAIRRRRTRLAS